MAYSRASNIPKSRCKEIVNSLISNFLSKDKESGLLKITVADQTNKATQIIRHIISPWKVNFTDLNQADVSILYGGKFPRDNPAIIIPSNSQNFIESLKDRDINVAKVLQKETVINATQQTRLSMVSKVQYDYKGSIELIPTNIHPPPVQINDACLLLRLDMIEEYERIIDKILNPQPSLLYRLLTGLTIPYSLAPKRVRNLLMRSKVAKTDLNLLDKLPLDTLRFLLVKAIEVIAGKKMEKKDWNGKSYVYSMTHDIESSDGLKKAKVLKRLEERYDIPSAWYIPAGHSKFDPKAVEELANHGEIGVHGTQHDGKLAAISKQQLLQRLLEARRAIDRFIDCKRTRVLGFRAPLLQHNSMILDALAETGYDYDTSVPTWEPKHPYVMSSHGIGTVYPMKLNKITEIPLTLPQDHQMLHVLGMTPKSTVQTWIRLKETIKDIGGICSILVHPDYEFSDARNLDSYEELLNDLASDKNAWATTPAEIETWFSKLHG